MLTVDEHSTLVAELWDPPVRVLLLDEPFTALDAGSVDRAVDLTRKRAVESVVVLSTHQRALVEQMSTPVERAGEDNGP